MTQNQSASEPSARPMTTQLQITAKFAAAAVIALIVGVEPWRRGATKEDASTDVVRLFPNFTDPTLAKKIEILRWDEDSATPHSFSVQMANGRWVIPSNENYPADAREHMAEAAVSVMDLESLSQVSNRPGDFQTYGVVAPDPQTLKPGATGVGMQVTFKDGADKTLADIIVGKKDKDQQDLRFVRVAGRDQIYKVKLNTDKLSTKFQDWIEKDLLKLNAFDIREVQLNDYSLEDRIDRSGQPVLAMVRRSKIKLDYDDEKSKWSLGELVEYKARQAVPGALGDDEELNNEKLNALRSAIDDLQIVDVQRKPAGLSQDLRATEEFGKDREAAVSLQKRGFYADTNDQGQTEIFSTEGEVLAFVKDGVAYTLRFGDQTLAGASAEEKKDKNDADAEKKGSRLNRYLFVSCKFLEDRIPKPELQELPPAPEGAKPDGAENKDGAAPADAKPADDKPAPQSKQSSTGRGQGLFRLTADEKPVPAKPADPPAATPPAGAGPAAATQPAGDKPAAESAEGGKIRQQALEAKEQADKRAAIEKENKRKQADYDDKIKRGRDHAKELNDRFADWYYVISDEVYHKIHLSRSDVIKKKEKEAGKGDGVGDFNAIKGAGLGGAMPHDHDHDHKADKPKK